VVRRAVRVPRGVRRCAGIGALVGLLVVGAVGSSLVAGGGARADTGTAPTTSAPTTTTPTTGTGTGAGTQSGGGQQATSACSAGADCHGYHTEAFWSAVAIVALFALLVLFRGGALFVGPDNRVSTSKTISALWTAAIGFMVLVLGVLAVFHFSD